MGISEGIKQSLAAGSWIRKMFEEGIRLRAKLGADKVFDFSIGNPDVPPPPEFDQVIAEEVARRDPMIHTYMPNGGYRDVRGQIAEYYQGKVGLDFTVDDLIMTSGAGGGLNVLIKSLLDPGDEIVAFAPYFMEYGFYVKNHGGRLVVAQTTEDFLPDMAALRAAVTPRTRAVILNSPNNPTGRMYPREVLEELGRTLTELSAEIGSTIYLVSDEPYREIVYDGLTCTSPFLVYDHTIVITSHSKDLSLAGERIGHVIISPRCEGREDLQKAVVFCNRTLGFVNANALMQRVVGRLMGVTVDTSIYQARRDMLCDALAEMGYEFIKPEGAFYLFPKTPVDEGEFAAILSSENIIIVPGSGFGRSGHFRISYAVSESIIQRALPGFRRAMERAKELKA